MTTPVPRATRPTRGRVIAGVARGLAEHLRLPVWLVRVGFVVLALGGGVGIVLYVAFWAVLPQSTESDDVVEDEDASGGALVRLIGLAAVLIGGVLLLSAMGVDVLGSAVIPLVIALVGGALVWQQADDDQRAEWSTTAAQAARRTAGSTARAGRGRILAGLALVTLGIVGLLITRAGPAAAMQSLATAVLLIVGIALVVFPWAHRRWRDQQEQRRALIRSEERADIAAHVHDSVLQTLTLIQRNANDPAEVGRLARTEEHALRAWLYAPEGDPEHSFAARLRVDASEVEQAYGAAFEVVSVGDGPIDAATGALLAATREAMVNVARHGGGQASVYAEIDDDAAEVYVRDRGPGFDLASVPADRHGLRDSVVGRIERNGGTATVISSAAGTEVRLHMPRAATGGTDT